MINADTVALDLEHAAPRNRFGDPIQTERPGWYCYVSEREMDRREIEAIRHRLGPLFRMERMRRFIFVEVGQ
jgi:hypothetical protein